MKLNKKALLDCLRHYHEVGFNLGISDYEYWKFLSLVYYNFDDYAKLRVSKFYLLDRIISRYS